MEKRVVMDEDAMKRAVTRMTYEIIERNKGTEELAIVGIKTRGEHLGQRIINRLEDLEGVTVPFLALDISAYRDDVEEEKEKSIETDLDLEDKHVFLVDDVLQTGRTVRAAMDAVMDVGRARKISLVVLVDRGHRELPIRADIVGKNLPTSSGEMVAVHLAEYDGEDNVSISR